MTSHYKLKLKNMCSLDCLVGNMNDDVEIIDFFRPDENENNLFITGLPVETPEEDIREYLFNKFSLYGLIYEVQVCSGSTFNNVNQYAFVKFYSRKCAQYAKCQSAGRLYHSGIHLKVRNANRKKVASNHEPKQLYITKCYELANHYLGFNGWSLSLSVLKENKAYAETNENTVQYVCAVQLSILKHDLQTEGCGASVQCFSSEDPSSRSVAICKAQKAAHQQAVQNAFSKVLLLILDNGKVFPEINTTIEHQLEQQGLLVCEETLKVNELDTEPSVDTDSEADENSDDLDLLNRQLLEALAEES